jgi:hypothetical protein
MHLSRALPLVILVSFCASGASSALAAEPEPDASATAVAKEAPAPPVDTSKVDAALAALAQAAPGQARLDAAAKLIAATPADAPALAIALARPMKATDAERRLVLEGFHADVPTPEGRFKPRPAAKKGATPPPEPDWLAELAKSPDTSPALVDCLTTVVLLRALAATKTFEAANAMLGFAFTADGITFRDECGRQLRAMSPYSLATLLRASQEKKRSGGTYAAYATFQLDRLDKNRPSYALNAAPDDVVEVQILNAIRDSKHPDAVPATMERCGARSPQVRHAAREAFMAYVTGPLPPPAPKSKRKLPGGKMSDEEMPLYLTYRELARQEAERKLVELGGTVGRRAKDAEVVQQVFDLLDQQRAKIWDEQMAAAVALAGEQKWAEAAAKFDDILIAEPLYTRRGEMTPTFLALGKQLAAAKKWDGAVIAFEKAYSLDPAGANAADARAELHVARAEVLRAQGKPAEDELAQALSADPGHEGARGLLVQEQKDGVRSSRGWMLYAGLGGIAAAILATLAALWTRRRAAA